MTSADHHSFGIHKPVGHVVISFPDADKARRAVHALSEIGFGADVVHHYTDREMLERIDAELVAASPMASIGQELNLARAQRELAALGYHWLVVRAKSDGRAFQIADCVRQFGAERAQYYGHFVIEELIEHATDTPQVAESPERGLNAQTPSGMEAERASLRQARPQQ